MNDTATIADPEAYVAAIEARARRVETPCGDGTMVWRIWGERPGARPVVFAHGSHGDWTHWIANIEALAERYTMIVCDLPSHGDSALAVSEDHDGLSAPIAEGLRLILGDSLPVDLVGFSMGGVIFGQMMARNPDIASRLIVIGAGGLGTPHGPVNIGRVGGLRGEERKAALKANLMGLMLHSAEAADDLAIHLLDARSRKARIKVLAGLVKPDRLLQVLPQIHVPVDAIFGANDRPHPDPAVQERALRAVLPDCDFRVIPEAGHWAMYERTEAFNATLIDMLG
jgi:pimeloyl-ACP methyl ester carboxylesterase